MSLKNGGLSESITKRTSGDEGDLQQQDGKSIHLTSAKQGGVFGDFLKQIFSHTFC